MCNGYYEICNCKDCKRVKELYEQLEWYENNDREEFSYEVLELEDKIENLGYWV